MTANIGDTSPPSQRQISPMTFRENSRSLGGMDDNPEIEDSFVLGLRAVMDLRGEKAAPLAERAGLGITAIRDLFRKASSPKISTALAISDAMGLTIDQVIAAGRGGVVVGVAPALPASGAAGALVPVFDVAASAGNGAHVEGEDVICNMAFDSDFLKRMTDAKPKDLAIIRVKGHSMEPALLDDDHVLVDRTKTNLSYDGLFVIRFDDALHVKRIGRSATRGNVMVISDHPSYRDLDMPKADLDVIGRVLWVGRKV